MTESCDHQSQHQLNTKLVSWMRPMTASSYSSSCSQTFPLDNSIYNTRSNTSTSEECENQKNIKVAIRVRPRLEYENENLNTIELDPEENPQLLRVLIPDTFGDIQCRDFSFDACLGQGTDQQSVMDKCGIYQLLDAALNGYNVSILVYGQTGSGKTYTMTGKNINEIDMLNEHSGIIMRSAKYIISQCEKNEETYMIKGTFYELYNENVYDLIKYNKKNLAVKWDEIMGFYIPELSWHQCTSLNKLNEIIIKGIKNRRVSSHELNIESSRSHMIFTLQVEMMSKDNNGNIMTKRGKVSFIDLAGSERLKDSLSNGIILKETMNINKSLFVLGKVISALSKHNLPNDHFKNGGHHVPYRDSVLTKILKDSLGGNALTLIIGCCSPLLSQIEETLSTLLYASRAKHITNLPVLKVIRSRESEIQNLKNEIESLKNENLCLRKYLASNDDNSKNDILIKSNSVSNNNLSLKDDLCVRSRRESLNDTRQLMKQLTEERKDLSMDNEMMGKKNNLKSFVIDEMKQVKERIKYIEHALLSDHYGKFLNVKYDFLDLEEEKPCSSCYTSMDQNDVSRLNSGNLNNDKLMPKVSMDSSSDLLLNNHHLKINNNKISNSTQNVLMLREKKKEKGIIHVNEAGMELLRAKTEMANLELEKTKRRHSYDIY